MLVRTASNAYFPQTMSVISLPDRDEADRQGGRLRSGSTTSSTSRPRRPDARNAGRRPGSRRRSGRALDEEVFAEIQARRHGGTCAGPRRRSSRPSSRRWSPARRRSGATGPTATSSPVTLPRHRWDKPWMAAVERVVLVHRLREVMPRSGSPGSSRPRPTSRASWRWASAGRIAGPREHLAAGRREPRRGDLHPVQGRDEPSRPGWRSRAVRRRAELLAAGSSAGRRTTREEPAQVPRAALRPAPFAVAPADHRVSLECGYPASSIRERIYAGPDRLRHPALHRHARRRGDDGRPGRGRPQIDRHLRRRSASGGLCSNDPVCRPARTSGELRPIPHAACHGCLLIAETPVRAAQRFPRPGPRGLHCTDNGASSRKTHHDERAVASSFRGFSKLQPFTPAESPRLSAPLSCSARFFLKAWRAGRRRASTAMPTAGIPPLALCLDMLCRPKATPGSRGPDRPCLDRPRNSRDSEPRYERRGRRMFCRAEDRY